MNKKAHLKNGKIIHDQEKVACLIYVGQET